MKKVTASNKMLIVLPFWEGDKSLATRLVKHLAELEPAHSDEADILLVARFDCKHDPLMTEYASRKFNIHTYTSKRRGTGWPSGCNSLFFGAMEWVYHKMASGQVLNYETVFIMGADGAPFKRDWIALLKQAWKALPAGTNSAGALIPGAHEHINGDCMILSGNLKFLRWLVLEVGDISAPAGWDWILADEFKLRGWADIPGIRSIWNFPLPFTQADWDEHSASGTVWLHGVKSLDLINLGRKNLL